MKTFHFYLILVLAIMAGFVTLMAKSNAPDFKALSALPFLLTVFSVLFAFLDRRNKELVRNGEAAVKHLDELENLEDSEGLPNVLKIFARDDALTDGKPKTPLNHSHISYSTVLMAVFWIFGLGGVVLGLVLLNK